jgi:hypothetical protein
MGKAVKLWQFLARDTARLHSHRDGKYYRPALTIQRGLTGIGVRGAGFKRPAVMDFGTDSDRARVGHSVVAGSGAAHGTHTPMRP